MPNFAKIDKKSVYTTIIGLFLMAVLSLTKIIPELSLKTRGNYFGFTPDRNRCSNVNYWRFGI